MPVSPAELDEHEETLAIFRAELPLARFAIPAALVVCWMLAHTALGQAIFRLTSDMWLHELGHAVMAWLCGFPALPGPWATFVEADRSYVFAFALAAALGWGHWLGRQVQDRILAGAMLAVLVVLVAGTLLVSERSAHALISFAGDAGSLVFGAALMATFFAPPGHKLHRDHLRWGFLALGAGSFTDTFSRWWAARTNVSVIPFGVYEHGGASDATALVADHGWAVPTMTGRYVALGVLCLLGLIAGQVLHVRRTQAALRDLEAEGDEDQSG